MEGAKPQRLSPSTLSEDVLGLSLESYVAIIYATIMKLAGEITRRR